MWFKYGLKAQKLLAQGNAFFNLVFQLLETGVLRIVGLDS